MQLAETLRPIACPIGSCKICNSGASKPRSCEFEALVSHETSFSEKHKQWTYSFDWGPRPSFEVNFGAARPTARRSLSWCCMVLPSLVFLFVQNIEHYHLSKLALEQLKFAAELLQNLSDWPRPVLVVCWCELRGSLDKPKVTKPQHAKAI